MTTDRRIRTVGGEPLRGRVRLPELPGVQPVRDPVADRIGLALRDHAMLVAAAAGAGALYGASAVSGGMLRRTLAAVGGAGAGIAGSLLLGMAAGMVGGSADPAAASYTNAPAEPPATDRPTKPEQLRVMSWNVRELIGPDGQIRRDDDALRAIAETIRRERPDVLVLQEVSQHSLLGAWHDGLEELARELGATDAVLTPNGMRITGKGKGGAVLTFGATRIEDARGIRHPDIAGESIRHRVTSLLAPLEHVGVDLPDGLAVPYQPRTTTDAVVTTPAGRAVRVLGVHLSGTGVHTGGTPGSDEAQQRQLVPLVQTLDAWDGPTLLAGDFNVNGGTRHAAFEARVLAGEGMRDTLVDSGTASGHRDSWSFPAAAPRRNIDRMYASPHFEVQRSRVLADDLARAGSDHLPVISELVLR